MSASEYVVVTGRFNGVQLFCVRRSVARLLIAKDPPGTWTLTSWTHQRGLFAEGPGYLRAEAKPFDMSIPLHGGLGCIA